MLLGLWVGLDQGSKSPAEKTDDGDELSEGVRLCIIVSSESSAEAVLLWDVLLIKVQFDPDELGIKSWARSWELRLLWELWQFVSLDLLGCFFVFEGDNWIKLVVDVISSTETPLFHSLSKGDETSVWEEECCLLNSDLRCSTSPLLTMSKLNWRMSHPAATAAKMVAAPHKPTFVRFFMVSGSSVLLSCGEGPTSIQSGRGNR